MEQKNEPREELIYTSIKEDNLGNKIANWDLKNIA